MPTSCTYSCSGYVFESVEPGITSELGRHQNPPSERQPILVCLLLAHVCLCITWKQVSLEPAAGIVSQCASAIIKLDVVQLFVGQVMFKLSMQEPSPIMFNLKLCRACKRPSPEESDPLEKQRRKS